MKKCLIYCILGSIFLLFSLSKAAPEPGRCLPDWEDISPHGCFYIDKTNLRDFFMTLEFCTDKGGFMVEFLTQEVERAVHDYVGDLVYGIYLGLFGDAHASSWSWIHSNVVANETNWHPGHPGEDPYRCAISMLTNGPGWYNWDCTSYSHSVCMMEYDLSMV